MAFVPTSPLPRHLRGGKPGHCMRRPRSGGTVTMKLPKSHPYGNGGIPSKPDYTGWDEARLMEEFAEVEANFRPASEDPGIVKWAIVMSADILQWDNNLFKASVEHGFQWDLRGINVVPIHERTARRCIERDTTDLWVLLIGDEGVLSVSLHELGQSVDEGTEVLLTFPLEEDAERFADQLAADGKSVNTRLISIDSLKQLCTQDDMILGLVPARTLVSPAQFNMTF